MATMIERSVDNLQRLYTIVIGLALTEAVARFILGPGYRSSQALTSGELYQAQYAATMIAFLVTLVPFYHGANRYLDETYAKDVRPTRPFTLLIDFLVLFIEAMIFFVMALRLNEWQLFFKVFTWLLTVDVVWIAIVFFYSGTFGEVWKWGVINLVGLGAAFILLNTGLLPDEPKRTALVAIAVLRTVFDYLVNWKFFHPENPMAGAVKAPDPAATRSPDPRDRR